MQLVEDIRDRYHHPNLVVIGLVLNEFVQQNRRTQRRITDQLEQAQRAGKPLFQTPIWGRIPEYTVVEDSQDYQAPLSYFLSTSESREPARRVCKAIEAHAIRLLEAIGHPGAAEIKAAWQAARSAERRGDEGPPDSRRAGRHRRGK
jgi:cellulose biosynthesis protein BcsQ